MNKIKTMPKICKGNNNHRYFLYTLCLLSYFLIGRFITLSDQGLSSIGLGVSAAVGVSHGYRHFFHVDCLAA